MQGVRAAGGTPIEINTIAINDAITTGSEGMKTSLVSRELIADSVELVARGHMLDGLVTISGCDKTIPAMAMVLGRLDIPGLTLFGGSIMAGRCARQTGVYAGRDLTVQDVYEAIGAYHAGTIKLEELKDVEDTPAPALVAAVPVHGEHHGNGLRVARHFTDGLERRARNQRAQTRPCLRRWQARDAVAAGWHHAALHRHATELRERHRRRDGHGRVHQRGPAPAADGEQLRCGLVDRREDRNFVSRCENSHAKSRPPGKTTSGIAAVG